jgi:hypothetical protein
LTGPLKAFDRPLADLLKAFDWPFKCPLKAFEKPVTGLLNAFDRPFKGF